MDIVDIANLYIDNHNKYAEGIVEQIRAGQHEEAWRNHLKWIRSLGDGHILSVLTQNIMDPRLHTAQSVRGLAQTLTCKQVYALLVTNLNELASTVPAVRECYHNRWTQFRDPKFEVAAEEIIHYHYLTEWQRTDEPETASEWQRRGRNGGGCRRNEGGADGKDEAVRHPALTAETGQTSQKEDTQGDRDDA